MTEEKQSEETRNAADIFNRLDDRLRDKFLNGVKCLLFLQDLAEVDGDEPQRKNAAQPA